jgi:hypothetical protein
MTAMEHIRYFAETIGPRGSTTPKEEQAARYAAQVLEQAGIEPVTETFTSARSNYHPLVLSTGLFLLGVILFWIWGRTGAIIAFVLCLLALVATLLELALRPNPLRWLIPKGRSQNVLAKVPASAQTRTQVVITGHLDSHRTPLIFSSDQWVKIFSTFVPLGLVSIVLSLILLGVGILSSGLIWRILLLPFALVVLGLFLLMLQADFTPYTMGANDNASGAGIVLSLAERLKGEPLANTTVWTVLTGCEEVGDYGAEAFAQAHKPELKDSIWMAVDSVGGKDTTPTYLAKETFLLTSPSDPQLIKLAGEVAKAHPEIQAQMRSFRGAYTEGAIGYKYGFRVLSFVNFRRDGMLPGWHRPTDVVGNIDPEVVAHSEGFLWEILKEIDREAGS